MVPLGLYMTDLPKEKIELQFQLYQLHKSIGITILLLSVLRVLWRIFNRPPPLPEGMATWEKVSAKFTHYAFYFLILAVPFVGWGMVSTAKPNVPTVLFSHIYWPHIAFFHDSANRMGWNEFFDKSHSFLAWTIVALLVLHIGAALKHHFFERDDVLARMVPFVRPMGGKL